MFPNLKTETQVELFTRCNCKRYMILIEPLPLTIRVPLLPRRKISFIEQDETLQTSFMEIREFERYSKPYTYIEKAGPISIALPPDPPKLIQEEYADAISRFLEFQNNMFKEEWFQVKLDFCARHDGANLIMHKSGALVGAFYPAPQWETAEEFIHLMSILRKTIDGF